MKDIEDLRMYDIEDLGIFEIYCRFITSENTTPAGCGMFRMLNVVH